MKSDDSIKNENDDSDSERIEQLLQANAQLSQQLASLTSLSASLAQHQAGDVFMWFNEGTSKVYLNARSIRTLSLQQGMRLGDYDHPAGPSGTFAVLADELPVTEHLPPEEAEQVLDLIAETINRVLQPPQ